MSTFNGLIVEFPDIRIDFFRRHDNVQPPLACFLSHVHSDHLAGLETLRSPFVYCSAATKEILLRLERYPCRINYARGILEARQQTYKHLARVLKTIPLSTPTIIELQLGTSIQVTLLDANHCPGAVMFLIEGGGKAILYTGDMRCEPWFVNAISRNPFVLEYTTGIKTLDKIYLDTSFTGDAKFQAKADGIAELLRKVVCYSPKTVFHLQAWTYGYEDVWLALAKALNSQIHVDDYKMRIYNALSFRIANEASGKLTETFLTPEAPGLTGYMCGNSRRQGCLTSDDRVRIHSCEKGNLCASARGKSVIKIQPVVAHLQDGRDMLELGVGGGADDLEREAELNFLTPSDIESLLNAIAKATPSEHEDQEDKHQLLMRALSTRRGLTIDLALSDLSDELSTDLQTVIRKIKGHDTVSELEEAGATEEFPKVIRFPYSRHSSYPELCSFVQVFKPKDVWPCTESIADWSKQGLSIRSLFGTYCSANVFAYDLRLEDYLDQQVVHPEHEETRWPSSPIRELSSTNSDLQSPPSDQRIPDLSQSAFIATSHKTDQAKNNDATSSHIQNQASSVDRIADTENSTTHASIRTNSDDPQADGSSDIHLASGRKRKHDQLRTVAVSYDSNNNSQLSQASITSNLSENDSALRHNTYHGFLEGLTSNNDDLPMVSLLSTNDNHAIVEIEL